MLKSNIQVGDLLMTDTVPHYIYLDSGDPVTDSRWTRSVIVVSLDAIEHTHLPGRVVVLDGARRVAIDTSDLWQPGNFEQRWGYANWT